MLYISRKRLSLSLFNKKSIGLLLVILSTSNTFPVSAQTKDKIVLGESGESVYFPDYSYAGYHFGEQKPGVDASTKIVNVSDFGAIPNDGKNDTAPVLKALKHAHSVAEHVTLLFEPGRYILKDILKIERSNITIAGAGMGDRGTQLYFPMPLSTIDNTSHLDELRQYLALHNKKQRDPEIYIDSFFSEYSWSGGVIWIQKKGSRAVPYLEEEDTRPPVVATILEGKRGETFIKVDNAKNIKENDILRIDWHNTEGPKGKLLHAIYGQTDLEIGAHHWNFPDRPLVTQPTQIKAIRGNIIEIREPLLHDISEELPAHFSSWGFLAEVGIKDLSIVFPEGEAYGHHIEQGFNGIYVTSVFNGWIHNVSFNNADSAILSENSANVTISNIHSRGTRHGHYGVHLGSVHNFLVEDAKIFNPTVHTFSMNTKATKNVFLRGEGFNQPTLDQHAGANHQNLYDNMTFHIQANRDNTGPYYDLWFGGGAGYWQPGHGRFNTTWNSKIMVQSGATDKETVRIMGRTEGPDARVIGIYGNRNFEVVYTPSPYLRALNKKIDIPSLYEYQKRQRLGN